MGPFEQWIGRESFKLWPLLLDIKIILMLVGPHNLYELTKS
jgi:hypothetical protein